MSVQEIKSEIARLSPSERSELESFLRAKRVAEQPGFREKVDAAQRRMDAGEAVNAVQLRAMLQANPAAAD
jgi:hypothetical protein